MSDSGDDWEKQLEDEGELDKNINKGADDKKKAFKDEDDYDSDEERKKQAELKKAAQAAAEAVPKKPKQGQKDYDKMFEERMKANKSSSSAAQARMEQIQKQTGLSAEAKAQQLQMLAEMDITESLFADLDVTANSLNMEKDYVNFGKKVSATLYQGQAPYRIPVFFKELTRDLSKHTDSKKIKEILDSVTALYNEKVKEEKDKEKKGGAAGGKSKAQLKSGKQHLNQQLVSNLMGDEDDYGEEEGGYARAKEEEYDFM